MQDTQLVELLKAKHAVLVADAGSVARVIALLSVGSNGHVPPVVAKPAKIAKRIKALKAAAARRAPVVSGSLEDRILTLAAEPVTMKALLEHAGARPFNVSEAVKALRDQARLIKIGGAANTKYKRVSA